MTERQAARHVFARDDVSVEYLYNLLNTLHVFDGAVTNNGNRTELREEYLEAHNTGMKILRTLGLNNYTIRKLLKILMEMPIDEIEESVLGKTLNEENMSLGLRK